MAGNIAACVPGTSPRAGTGHLVHAQTDALAEIAARCREAGGGGGARNFLVKELGFVI